MGQALSMPEIHYAVRVDNLEKMDNHKRLQEANRFLLFLLDVLPMRWSSELLETMFVFIFNISTLAPAIVAKFL